MVKPGCQIYRENLACDVVDRKCLLIVGHKTVPTFFIKLIDLLIKLAKLTKCKKNIFFLFIMTIIMAMMMMMKDDEDDGGYHYHYRWCYGFVVLIETQ